MNLTQQTHALIKPLLILDLNGTLMHRITHSDVWRETKSHPNFRQHDFTVNSNKCYLRPGVRNFLSEAMRRFTVAVWTSAKYINAIEMVSMTFGDSIEDLNEQVNDSERRLKFIWAQDACEAVHVGSYKPLFLKNLERVWQKYPQYNQHNTVIVDDNPSKILEAQQSCLEQIREFRVDDPEVNHTEDNELDSLIKRLKSRFYFNK